MKKLLLVSIISAVVLLAGCTGFYQEELARGYVENSPTYQYDGSGLELINISEGPCEDCRTFTYSFESAHAGYGDRSGQVVAQVITPHSAGVTVKGDEVVSAVMDGEWDMARQRPFMDEPQRVEKTYVSRDLEQCETIQFLCAEGTEPFFDEEGCGCQPQMDEEPPKLERSFCEAGDRSVDACIEVYQPVCGWFNPDEVQCVKYPCARTFSNSCFACQNPDVLYFTEGECPA